MAPGGARRNLLGVWVVAALAVVGACSGDIGADDELLIVRDVPVAGVTVTDVFATPGAVDDPVVVMLHGTEGERSSMEPLARAVAAGGSVVFVPQWPVIDQVAPYPASDGEPYRQQVEAVVCSLRFARRRAASFGGRPEDLTVLGQSGGAMAGGRVALVDPLPWPDVACDPDTSHVPQRLIGLSGDYAGANQYGVALPEIYAPYDLLRLDPTNSTLEVRLVHGFDDRAVDYLSAWRFDRRLVEAGLDSRLIAADTGHSDLRDPMTPGGRFVVDQVDALLHGRTSAYDAEPRHGSLTAGPAACRYEGPTSVPRSDVLRIELRNQRPELVWFSLVGLRDASATVADLERAEPGSFGARTGMLDFGGFQPVAPVDVGHLDWVFLDAAHPWVAYCMSDPPPAMSHPSTRFWNAEVMEPASILVAAD